jgi:hypothetical protein
MRRMRSISAVEYCSLTAVHCPQRTPTPKICSFYKMLARFCRVELRPIQSEDEKQHQIDGDATLPGQPARNEVEGASPRSTQVPTLSSECA